MATTPMKSCVPPGPEPTKPELRALEVIHRHPASVVSFHRKTPAGHFENLFGIRREHLAGLFPEFEAQLETDAFFSINAYWHGRTEPAYLPVNQLRKREPRLLCLNAAFVDLDFYKLNLDIGTAFAAIISRQERGLFPPISIIVRSGRGLWLLWLLHDAKQPERPPRAWPEKLLPYLEINRAANAALAELGADPAAVDVQRLIRMEGSRNPRLVRRIHG